MTDHRSADIGRSVAMSGAVIIWTWVTVGFDGGDMWSERGVDVA